MLDGYHALPALRASWQALGDCCPWTTPFQRPEWLMPWVQHFGPTDPWLLVAHAEDRLVGLVPLFRYQRDASRVLALLGAGISDYVDALIAPGWERAVLAAVVAQLEARRAHWDMCELDDLRLASPLVTLVPGVTRGLQAGVLPVGWTAQLGPCNVCPVLPLPPYRARLAQHVPERHLARFRRYLRRARREGALCLQRATEARDVPPLLDGLFRLHGASWQRRGGPGVLDGAVMRSFHTEAAAGFAARNALALYGLWLDDHLIACLYGFHEGRTMYLYLGGFDPDWSHLNPGTLSVGLAIEDLIQRGMSRLDFLRGSEPHKYWWGAEDRCSVRVSLRWSARTSARESERQRARMRGAAADGAGGPGAASASAGDGDGAGLA